VLCAATLQLEEDATAAAAASAASSSGKAAAAGAAGAAGGSANGASRRTASATPVEETVDEEEVHAITHLSKQPPSLQGQLRNYQVCGCLCATCTLLQLQCVVRSAVHWQLCMHFAWARESHYTTMLQ
jgi:hypothetical protein